MDSKYTNCISESAAKKCWVSGDSFPGLSGSVRYFMVYIRKVQPDMVTARSRGTAMMVAWQQCSIIGHQEFQLAPKWTECIKQNHAGSRPLAQRGLAEWAISNIIYLIFQLCVDMKLLFGTLWNYLWIFFFLGIRSFCFPPLKKAFSRLIQLTSRPYFLEKRYFSRVQHFMSASTHAFFPSSLLTIKMRT